MSDQPKPITGEWTSHTAYNLYRKDDGFYSIADAHNAALAAEREHGQQECDRLDAFWQNQLSAEREKVKELEQLRTLTLERYLTNEQKRIIQQLREQLAAEKQRADEAEQGELNEARKLNVGDQPETGDWRVQQSNGIWLLLDCENKVITAMLSKEVALEIASRHNLALNPLMDEIERLTDQLAAGRDTWKRLESWFPLTAREIQQLRSQLAAAQAAIAEHNAHVTEMHTASSDDCYEIPMADTTELDAAISEATKPLVDALRQIRDELKGTLPVTALVKQIATNALAKVKEGK